MQHEDHRMPGPVTVQRQTVPCGPGESICEDAGWRCDEVSPQEDNNQSSANGQRGVTNQAAKSSVHYFGETYTQLSYHGLWQICLLTNSDDMTE
jgi:hypothetical protein